MGAKCELIAECTVPLGWLFPGGPVLILGTRRAEDREGLSSLCTVPKVRIQVLASYPVCVGKPNLHQAIMSGIKVKEKSTSEQMRISLLDSWHFTNTIRAADYQRATAQPAQPVPMIYRYSGSMSWSYE